jgi:DNA-directed RNA polymerase specialized sigma24 family protein
MSEYILTVAKKLPPMENLVFHLRDMQDLSIEEIAEVAGTSVGSVKTNLCYARRRIRMAVTKMQESEGS